jgi:hypothetical protein
LEKNSIPEDSVKSSKLLSRLLNDGNTRIIEKDVDGNYHFNGSFNNATFLREGLENLVGYDDLVTQEKDKVLSIYEQVFNHKAFTGRSGTFFGYEGLGSIYWHMVSKLLLAVMECTVKAIEDGEPEEVVGRLLQHFYAIVEGIGAHKPPKLYGAFPTDPYSHTPMGKGAQQPGMTGQVKEDILSRMGELGVFVRNGKIHFNPCMLRAAEFLKENSDFHYVDIQKEKQSIELESDSIAFTYCQVPVIYQVASKEEIEVIDSKGQSSTVPELSLDKKISESVFKRTGEVQRIIVSIQKTKLR